MDSQEPTGKPPREQPFIQPPPGLVPPPQQKAEPQKPPPLKSEPSGPPPPFKEQFETGLRALFSPDAVFKELAGRRAPPFAESAFAGVVWGVGASGLALLIIQMKLPVNAGLSLLTLFASFAALVTASALVVILGACLFHGISIVSGGSGGFDRSLQSLAHLAALFPLLAALLWISNPLLWILPTLWMTWLSVHAIEKLHDADSGQVFVVAGALGLACVAAQVVGRATVARAHYRVEDSIINYAVNPQSRQPMTHESAKSLHAPNRARRSAPPAMPNNPMNIGGRVHANPVAGSLGMIRQPNARTNLAGDPSLQMPQMQIPTDPAQMQQLGMGMLTTIKSQLANNPEALNKLPPEQKALIDKYLKIAEMAAKGDMDAIKQLNPEQIREDSENLTNFANRQGRPTAPEGR